MVENVTRMSWKVVHVLILHRTLVQVLLLVHLLVNEIGIVLLAWVHLLHLLGRLLVLLSLPGGDSSLVRRGSAFCVSS